MNDMYSSPLRAGTELKPGSHYKLQEALDQAQERRGLGRVAEHLEPACISPNQDLSVLSPPRSLLLSQHLPGTLSHTSEGCPSCRALTPELF